MVGEFALIERLLGHRLSVPTTSSELLLGPGDDCALIASPAEKAAWAISTDMLVEGTHFLNTDNPEDLGWKTLAVNLSDLAAMGATPRYATLAAAITSDDNSRGWIDRFFSGFKDCADYYGVTLIGGDTTRGPRTFCVTVLGSVSAFQALKRSGAVVKDDIWISGNPGYAALGLWDKQGKISLPLTLKELCYAALHHPRPRIDLGCALLGLAHSCLDVSDGLLQDLKHITQASECSASLLLSALPVPPSGIDYSIWLAALLGGGDDYELLFTAPISNRESLQALSMKLNLPLQRIGMMLPGDEAGTIQLVDHQGQPVDLSKISSGFDHFA
jgi:thiamine-monophosphate kinase